MDVGTSRAASDPGRGGAGRAAGPPGRARRLWALAPALVVTFCSAMALYYQALVVAPVHHHSFETFYAFDRVADARLVKAWTPRVFSRAAAEWLGAHSSELPQFRTALKRTKPEAVRIGQWLFVWFGLVGLALVAAYREQAMFHVLGTYACVAFGYIAGTERLRIYPWDMPALAVFTVVVALIHRRWAPWWIVLAIWVGMPFKETAAVLCLFPLALALPWRRRGLYAALALLGCALIKVGIDLATANSAVGVTMAWGSFRDEGSLIAWNLRELARGYPLAVNGGTLLALLLLPTRRRELVAFKAIAAAFVVGNFCFGMVSEFRIWFEMIPLALYALWAGSRPAPELPP